MSARSGPWTYGKPPDAEVELRPPLTLPALDPEQAAPKEPGAGAPERVAVLVCHGMGQQVRFQTLMDMARSLRGAEGVEFVGRIGARAVQVGEKEHRFETHRVELTLRRPGGPGREVHLYEAYWAPLTEGKVGTRDVLAFLAGAAVNGYRNARGGAFRRWMFGRAVTCRVKATSTRRKLLGALAIVLSLLVINVVVGIVGLSLGVGRGRAAWPCDPVLVLLVVELLALILLLLLAWASFRCPRRTPGTPTGAALAWAGIWTALVGTVVIALLMLGEIVWSLCCREPGAGFPCWLTIAVLLLWSVLVALSTGVRYFLVEYLGDVAAYVSAHTVNKFYEVRGAIQQASCAVARAVYTALEEHRAAFEYGRIVVVGHSLGSVVAYDMLNAMIREDRAAATHFQAAARTPLLLTFGSPLNKTAFLFRTQMPEGSELREVLAASVQPMIQSYEHRPARWVNLYAPADWISGPLEYYDDPEDPDPDHAAKRVRNEIDPDATTPLAAHGEYWGNRLLPNRILEGILS